MEVLMAKAGEGAGDMVVSLNVAHWWANHYGTVVELEYHWREKQDFKVMPQDPETVAERMDDMHSRMANPNRVEVIHLFDSDIFYTQGDPSMWEEGEAALIKRIEYKPTRWFFPRIPDIVSENTETGNVLRPRGQWSEKPRTTKTIVMWDSSQNADVLRYTKKTRCDWGYMRDYIQDRFPEHKIISLSYRDSFDTAYNAIRDCEFCFGYEGMWHLVAENFGKLLICLTEQDAEMTATPDAKVLSGKRVLPYIDAISNKETLKQEQTLFYNMWQDRIPR